MNFVLVDKSKRAPAAKMLQAGVRAYNEEFIQNNGEPISLSVETFDLFNVTEIDDETDCTYFVAVSEKELLEPVENHGSEDVLSNSLRIAHTISRLEASPKVFLVIPRGHNSFSSSHTFAAFFAGVTGVVDDSVVLQAEGLHEIVKHKGSDRRYRRLLVIGEPIIQIQDTKEMLEDWKEDGDSDPTLDLATWRAAMALGQIEKLQPAAGGGDPYGFPKFALALNFYEGTTKFRLTPDDLRRVLSTLSRRWLGEDHQGFERISLPEFARRHGFPSTPPLTLGLSRAETIRRIYYAMQESEIVEISMVVDLTKSVIRVPIAHFRASGYSSEPKVPKSVRIRAN